MLVWWSILLSIYGQILIHSFEGYSMQKYINVFVRDPLSVWPNGLLALWKKQKQQTISSLDETASKMELIDL